MKLLDFQSENLVVDWKSSNFEGLMDPEIITSVTTFIIDIDKQ